MHARVVGSCTYWTWILKFLYNSSVRFHCRYKRDKFLPFYYIASSISRECTKKRSSSASHWIYMIIQYVYTNIRSLIHPPQKFLSIEVCIYCCEKVRERENSISTHEGAMMSLKLPLIELMDVRIEWNKSKTVWGVVVFIAHVMMKIQFSYSFPIKLSWANNFFPIIRSNEFISMPWWKCSKAFIQFSSFPLLCNSARVMWKSLNCNISALKSGAQDGW